VLNRSESKLPAAQTALNAGLTLALFVAVLFVVAGGLFFMKTTSSAPLAEQIKTLFALDSLQAWWYVTRAAGLMGYLLIWLSVVWGLVVSSKIFDPWLERMFTFDFHEHLSLLAIGFVALHVVVLLVDQFQPFTLQQILFPFISTYRPIWVGIGIITFYVTLLVTLTFYLRPRLSARAFRVIHYLSLLAYLGAGLHGLFAGTDSPLMAVELVYLFTFLSVVFLMVYWLIVLMARRREEEEKELQAALEKIRDRQKKRQKTGPRTSQA